MESFLYFFAGSLTSWLITMIYYRKSSVKAPEWAHELISQLPKDPIGEEALIKHLRVHLENMVVDGGTF